MLFSAPSSRIIIVFTLICIVSFDKSRDVAAADPKQESTRTSQRSTDDTTWLYYFTSQFESNPYLTRELELVDFQQKELQAIKKEMQAEYNQMMQEYRQSYRKDNYQQAQAEYREKLQEYKERYLDRVEEVLVPHQEKRLEQVVRQQKALYARGGGASSRYYTRRDEFDLPMLLAEELELSEKELEIVKTAIKESRLEMEDELKRIREESIRKVINSLPPDKRRRFDDLVGQPYDFSAARRAISKSYEERRRKERESKDKDDN